VELKASLHPAVTRGGGGSAEEEESLERACKAVGGLVHRMMAVCRPDTVLRKWRMTGQIRDFNARVGQERAKRANMHSVLAQSSRVS